MSTHLLLGCKGCGSAVVECALALGDVHYDYEEVDYSAASTTRDRLLSFNPLGQVPVLITPAGQVLTESAAILHYLDGLAPRSSLIPAPGSPVRANFYRWLFFLVAAVYPTFTYGDDPHKWVRDDAAAKQLRDSTDRHRQTLWRQVENAIVGPWFLGESVSALDLYLAVMAYWRPGPKWFEAHTPKITAIKANVIALPRFAPVIARNFA
jgi:GST-like protein